MFYPGSVADVLRHTERLHSLAQEIGEKGRITQSDVLE
jgi:hypothetical protein